MRILFSTLCLLFLGLPGIGLAQDINQIIAAQQIDTLLYSGPKDNRINWVIQNRGEDNANNEFPDAASFSQALQNDLLLTFEPGINEQVPYAQYRDFFNLYAFYWENALSESEGWNFDILHAIRDSFFLPWATEDYGWITFFSTTQYGGGGGAGLERDRRVGSGKLYGMGYETFLHEFGHTMPGLLDEYSSSGVWSGGQCWETPNTTGAQNYEDVPWRKWMNPGTPIPTPYNEEYLNEYGVFEGALTNFFGCHRPTARNCFMGAGGFGEGYGLHLCSPCIQRVICYLYQYVDVIENPIPVNQTLEVSGSETLTFSADIIKPNPNTQKYEWILNGRVIASQQESIDITFGTCESYELVLAVTDTTPLVRFDEKFAHIYPKPYQEHRWNITQLNPVSTDLSVDVLTQNADCSGLATGTVEFEINGGQAPYTVYASTVQLENPALELEPGVYSIDVVDALGCRITDEFVIEQDRLLDPEICSEFNAGQWNLVVQDGLYSNSELSVSWSTGANTFDLNELNDGQYTVTVTTDNGCSAVRSIDLVYADNALSAESLAFPSGLSNPSGRIYLQIEHGRPPYSISWFDKPNKDLTDNQSGTALSSGTNFGHIPEYAFDNSLNTKWLQNISSNAFIGYQFPTAVELKSYSITSADDVPERDPKDWLFQGSNNGSSWETLDQQTGFDFNSRFEKRSFLLNNSGSFTHYRLFVLSNHGNSAIQLQELEFTGVDAAEDFAANQAVSDQDFRTSLFPGLYKFEIKDSNQTAWVDSVTIDCIESSSTPVFAVVQANSCQVRVEPDSPDFSYYWMADKEGTSLLHSGSYFQPPSFGNYYLFVSDNNTNNMSEQSWGFAVTMPDAPELNPDTDTILSVLNPDPTLVYNWYAADECDTPLGQGPQFQPSQPGIYYVSAYKPTVHPDPIDPNSVGEILIRMDASDLDGDGIRDNPAPPSGSTYGWEFENGNKWSSGSWFAYRGNYQNGLGIADFGTIWLQRIENQEVGYQTVLMAYQENPLSFPESAPFESLSSNFPKHSDGSQILSNNTPANTLNGSFYWNGEQVDPLNTANDFQFNILGAVMAANSTYPVFYTDTYWEGKLGELILYKNALTEEEVLGVSEYLRQKWISTAELASPRTAVQFGTSSQSTITANRLDLILSPNPATNHLTVRGLTRASMLKIYSASGQLCASFEASQERMVLPVRDLLPGTYYLSVQDTIKGIHRVEKFIKQ